MNEPQATPTTPRQITKRIQRFLLTLNLSSSPIFLPFTFTTIDYKPGYCLNNCESENQRTGNAIIFGWMIWEVRKQSFIEAEFHAVIKRTGELVDVTPRHDSEKTVLFVPDHVRTATRIDDRTWTTWKNQKSSHGQIIQATAQIDIEDTNAKIHV